MKKIQTKYPFLLVHGFGFRDHEKYNYWGRIPRWLEQRGVRIYYGYQDANATIEENARRLAEEIHRLVKETGMEKWNVIAHSKGGLDMRYAISQLDIAPYIASLTTICTPHNGSRTVDALLKNLTPVIKVISKIADVWRRFCGDHRPDSYRAFCSFSTRQAEKFNRENPDYPGIYYQSYAFVMSHHCSDILFILPHLVVSIIEGENDGFLAPEAVKWGEFRGSYTGMGGRGISHWDEVDFHRRSFSPKITGRSRQTKRHCQKLSRRAYQKEQKYRISSILKFYCRLVQELAEKGY